MSYIFQFVDQTCSGKQCPMTVNHGGEKEVVLTLKNVGTSTWLKSGSNPVRLGTSGHNPNGTPNTAMRDRASAFYDSTTWLANNRIAMDQTSVAPGQNATFTFKMKVPVNYDLAGRYLEYFEPVCEGIGWMGNYAGINVSVLVPAPWMFFSFMWYGHPTTGDINYGFDPNYTPGDAAAKALDTPDVNGTIGRYDAANLDIIRWKIQRVKDMGGRGIIYDYWWDNNPGGSYRAKCDQVFPLVVNIMETEFPEMRLTVLIEPQNGNNNLHEIPAACYDHFYNNYGSSPVWMKHQGKLLIYSFLKRVGSATETRFITLSASTNNAAGSAFNFYALPNATVTYGYTSLIHTLDTRHLASAGIPTVVSNPTLGEGIWWEQYAYAKKYRDTIRIGHIYGLDEYHERAVVEPHYRPDSTAPNDKGFKDIQYAIKNDWMV